MRTRIRDEVASIAIGPNLYRWVDGYPSSCTARSRHRWEGRTLMTPGCYGVGFTGEFLEDPYFNGSIGRWQSITDEPNGVGSFNTCINSKIDYKLPVITEENRTVYTNRGGEFLLTSFGAVPRDAAYSMDYVRSFVGKPTNNMFELAKASANKGVGIRDDDFQAPVFLGELREFKDTFGAIAASTFNLNTALLALDNSAGMIDLLRSLGVKDVFEAIKKQRTPPGLTASQLNSLDLLRKFAVEPFVRDLVSLASLHTRLLELMKELSETKTYSAKGQYSRTDTASEDVNIVAYTGTVAYKATTQIYAHVDYVIDFGPDGPDFYRVLIDTLGFDNPANVAWELKPLSFIYDYFINISSFLSQFEPEGAFSGYDITRVSQGVSEKVSITASHQGITRYGTAVSGTVDYSYYHRRPEDFDITLAIPEVRLPSASQMETIMQVIFARLSRLLR